MLLHASPMPRSVLWAGIVLAAPRNSLGLSHPLEPVSGSGWQFCLSFIHITWRVEDYLTNAACLENHHPWIQGEKNKDQQPVLASEFAEEKLRSGIGGLAGGHRHIMCHPD